MKGIFINCPSCRKMLFKNAYIRVGSTFSGTCAKCGEGFTLRSESGKITLKVERTIQIDEDDDDGGDIVILSS